MNKMQKIIKKIAVYFSIVSVLFAISCDNWMKNDEFFEEIDEDVRVANAEVLTPFVRFADNSFGTTVPNGESKQKVAVPFTVQATVSSEYAFYGWKAFSTADFPTNKNHNGMFYYSEEDDSEKSYDKLYKSKELPAEDVEITPDASDPTKATVNIKRNRSDIFLMPVVAERPKIYLSVPQSGVADVVKNSPIRILFTKPMDTESLIADGKLTENIKIYQANGTLDNLSMEEITSWFTDVSLNDKGTMITIRLYGGDANRLGAKKMTPNKQVQVRISASVKDSHGYAMGSDSTIRFTVGSQDDTLAPVIDKIRAGRGNTSDDTSGRWGFNVTDSAWRENAGNTYFMSAPTIDDISESDVSYNSDNQSSTKILSQRTKDKVHIWIYAQDINNSANSTPQEGDVSSVITSAVRVLDADGHTDAINKTEQKEIPYNPEANDSSVDAYRGLESGTATGYQFTQDLTSLGDGLIRIDIAAEDTTGNNSTSSTTISSVNAEKKNWAKSIFVVKDSNAPNAASQKDKVEAQSTNASTNATGWFNATTIGTLYFSAKDSSGNLLLEDQGHEKLRSKAADLQWAIKMTSATNWISSASWKKTSENFVPTIENTRDGDVPVTFALKDDLGNTSSIAALNPIKYDNTSPTFGTLKFQEDADSSRGISRFLTLSNHTLEIPFTEETSGIQELEFSISAPTGANASGNPLASAQIYYGGSELSEGTDYTVSANKITFLGERAKPGKCKTGTLKIKNITLADSTGSETEDSKFEGMYKIKVKAKDFAGKESALSQEVNISVDTSSPIIEKIVVSTVDNFGTTENLWLSGANGKDGIADIALTVNENGSGIKTLHLDGDVSIANATILVNGTEIQSSAYELSGNAITFKIDPAYGEPTVKGSNVVVTIKGAVFKNRTSANYENALEAWALDFAGTESQTKQTYINGKDKSGTENAPGAKLKVDGVEPDWSNSISNTEFKVDERYVIEADKDSNTIKISIAATSQWFKDTISSDTPKALEIKIADTDTNRKLLEEWFSDGTGAGLCGVAIEENGQIGTPNANKIEVPYSKYSKWSDEGSTEQSLPIYIFDNVGNKHEVKIQAYIDKVAPKIEIKAEDGIRYWKRATDGVQKTSGDSLDFAAEKTTSAQTITHNSETEDCGFGKTENSPIEIFTKETSAKFTITSEIDDLEKISIYVDEDFANDVGNFSVNTASASISATAAGTKIAITATDKVGNKNTVYAVLKQDITAPTAEISSAENINTVDEKNYFGETANAKIKQTDDASGLSQIIKKAEGTDEGKEKISAFSTEETREVDAAWLKDKISSEKIVITDIIDNVGNQSTADSATLKFGEVSNWIYDDYKPTLQSYSKADIDYSEFTPTDDAPPSNIPDTLGGTPIVEDTSKNSVNSTKSEIWAANCGISEDGGEITLTPSSNIKTLKLELKAEDNNGILGWIETASPKTYYAESELSAIAKDEDGKFFVTFTKSSGGWGANTVRTFYPVDYAGNVGAQLVVKCQNPEKPSFTAETQNAALANGIAWFNKSTSIKITSSEPYPKYFNAKAEFGGTSLGSIKHQSMGGTAEETITISPTITDVQLEQINQATGGLSLFLYTATNEEVSDGVPNKFEGINKWQFDNTPPVIKTFSATDSSGENANSTVDSENKKIYINSNARELTFTFTAKDVLSTGSEGGSGVKDFYVSDSMQNETALKSLADSKWSEKPIFAMSASGTIYAYVRDKIKNINTTAYEIQVILDSNPPTVTIASTEVSATEGDLFESSETVFYKKANISFNYSDDIGVVAYAVTTTDAEPTDWTPVSQTTLGNKTIDDIGSVNESKIYVWAKDVLGNKEKVETEKTYTQDITAPSAPSILEVTDNSGGDDYHKRTMNTIRFGSNATSLTLNLSATDSQSEIKGYATSSTATTWTDTVTLSGADLSAGAKTIYARDNVGNVSDALTITLEKDETVAAPSATISGSPNAVLDSQTIYYNSAEMSLTLELSGDSDAKFSANSGSVSENTLILSPIPASVTITATDDVGNTKTLTLQLKPISSVTTPSVSSVSYKKGGEVVSSSDYYKKSGNSYTYNSNKIDEIVFNVSASDASGLGITYFKDGVEITGNAVSVSNPSGSVSITAKNKLLGLESDALELTFTVKDSIKNVDGATGSIVLNGTKRYVKKGASITLSEVSGAEYYFYEGAAKQTSRNFTLGTAGEYNFKAADDVGNISASPYAITADGTAPTVTLGEISGSVAQGYSGASASVNFYKSDATIAVSAEDTESGIAGYKITGGEYSESTAISFPNTATNAELKIFAKDKVGNESAGTAITKDGVSKWTAYSAGTGASFTFTAPTEATTDSETGEITTPATPGSITISGISTKTAVKSVEITGTLDSDAALTVNGVSATLSGKTFTFANPQIADSLAISGVSSVTKVVITDVFGATITPTKASANVFSKLAGGISNFFGRLISPQKKNESRVSRQISSEEYYSRNNSAETAQNKRRETALQNEQISLETTDANAAEIAKNQAGASEIAQNLSSKSAEIERLLQSEKISQNSTKKLEKSKKTSYKYKEEKKEISKAQEIESEIEQTDAEIEQSEIEQSTEEKTAAQNDEISVEEQIKKIAEAIAIATIIVVGGGVILRILRKKNKNK